MHDYSIRVIIIMKPIQVLMVGWLFYLSLLIYLMALKSLGVWHFVHLHCTYKMLEKHNLPAQLYNYHSPKLHRGCNSETRV